MPFISVENAVANEGQNLDFLVSLSEPALVNVTVQYRLVRDGSSSVETDDVLGGSGVVATLTIPEGETEATLSFGTRNFSDEFDENITLELFNPANADFIDGGPVVAATGIVLDIDGGSDRALFVSDPILTEGDSGETTAVFEIRLSEPFSSNVTLSYETVDGTATAGEDYEARSGSVTFVAGQTLATVEVDVTGDTAIETPETFSLVVTPLAGIAGIDDTVGVANILDNDTGTALPVLNVESSIAREGGTLAFAVTMSEPSLVDVTVQYRLVFDGSGSIETDDILGGSGTVFELTIPAGQTRAVLRFGTRNFSDEFDENITLELFDPSQAVLAGDGPVLTATGVVLDINGGSDRALFVSDPIVVENDNEQAEAVFEVRLSEPFSTDVTLSYETADGTAIAGEDYVATSGDLTFLAGQTIAFVTVPVIGDADVEQLETFSLVVAPVGGIAGLEDTAGIADIMDDDTDTALPLLAVEDAIAREGGNLSFAVTLSEPSLVDVSVQYRLVRDGASSVETDDVLGGSGSVFVLTIPAGETRAILNFSTRNFADEFDENITLELFNPDQAVLSGDGPVITATGTVLDIDGGSDRALFVSDPVVTEGDSGQTQAVFEIAISEPFTSDVTLTYETADGTARGGEDYVATSGSVTFLAGQTTASVAVDINGDRDVEGVETFSLVVSPVAGIAGLEDVAGIANILDEDSATGLPVITLESSTAREGGNLAFAVNLSEPSLLDVTVQYRLVGDGSSSVGTDDILGGNGQIFTLTIPAGDTRGIIRFSTRNFTDEVDENVTLELLNPTQAVLAGTAPTLTATGVILDIDGGSDRALFVSDPTVLETDNGTTEAVFEIRLSEPFTSDVTLNYTTADGTAISGRDFVATSGSITFLAGQTVAAVSVDVLGDITQETIETFSLIVTPVAGISGTDDGTGEARIINFVTPDTSGTDMDDVLVGSGVSEILRGLGGNDELIGRAGSDVLRGGTGDDRLEGGSSGDRLFGGVGIDTATYLTATSGVSLNLTAGIGFQGHANGDEFFSIENVVGSDFGDLLIGSAEDNFLSGGRRADELRGSAGDDILEGGGGGDIINGGSGIDTASFVTAGGAVALNLTSGVGFGGNANGDTYIRIENIIGSDFGDLLIGSAGDNAINGGRGADELRGSAGDDMLEGGGGGDIINGGSGIDTATFTTAGGGVTLSLTTGVGTRGNATGDTYIRVENVLGSAHDDVIVGSSDDNALQGWLGDDVLRGSAGDDTLNGGRGNDTLVGGSGDDVFVFRTGNGDDVIEDFSRVRDTIAFRIDGLEFDDLEIDNVAGNAVIDYGSGTIELEGLSATRVIEDMFDFG